MFKKSNYNIFVPYDNGDTIVFNPLSGAIGLFDMATLDKYHSNQLNESEINMLKEKGILIPYEYDELEKINSDRF